MIRERVSGVLLLSGLVIAVAATLCLLFTVAFRRPWIPPPRR